MDRRLDQLRRPLTRRTLLSAAGALTLAACSAGRGPDAVPGSPRTGTDDASATPGRTPTAVDIVTGLQVPWGLALLADGTALVSERDTALIKRVDGATATTVATVAGVRAAGEGGLLGLALAPDASRVFAYFTTEQDNRIVALPWDGTTLGAPEVIFDGIPNGTIHNGGRLLVGHDDLLYVGTGETGDRDLAQDRDSLGGKILRLTLDGDPAPGNPFDTAVWSLGHRNVQGLTNDPDGRLWACEFGASSFDEVNLIQAGGNYGWSEVEGEGDDADYVEPRAVWSTDDASPSGIAYWQGSLWMAALGGGRLWEVPLDGEEAGTPRAWFDETYGRLRTVAADPSGDFLWLSTSNTDGRGQENDGDDRLLKVTLT